MIKDIRESLLRRTKLNAGSNGIAYMKLTKENTKLAYGSGVAIRNHINANHNGNVDSGCRACQELLSKTPEHLRPVNG